MTKHEIANAMRTTKAECKKLRILILDGHSLPDDQFKTQVLHSLETIATAVKALALW